MTTILPEGVSKALEDPDYVEKANTTRAYHVIKLLVELGFLRADEEWQSFDRKSGMYLPLYFEVTPLFYQALGVTMGRIERHKQRRTSHVKLISKYTGVSVEKLQEMSESQFRLHSRQAFHRFNREKREKARQAKQQKRTLRGKDETQDRSEAINRVLNNLSQEDINQLDHEGFRHLVNMEVGSIRRMRDNEPIH